MSAAARGRTGSPRPPARLSLARTALALLDAPAPAAAQTAATERADAGRFRVTFGDVSLIAPPGALDGVAPAWSHGPRPLGGDPPSW